MQKYAKIVNEETGACIVGLGESESAAEYYESQGMELMEVPPVMPEAKKVESPTKANAAVSGSTCVTPCAMLMPAPMHRHVSTMSSGLALPRV